MNPNLLALLLLPLQAAPAQAQRVPVAVLESGQRVECQDGVLPGDRLVATPFGRFDASLDPVREVVDASGEVRLLEMVRQNDLEAWVGRVVRRGLLSELHAAARRALEENPEADHDILLSGLEAWGERLDPVPGKVDYEERVPWLWQSLQQADPATGSLLAGRLAAEIPGSRAPFERRIGLVELRKALRSPNPALRRGAAVVAARQAEWDMRRNLVGASLEDPTADVRLASAGAAASIDERTTLGRWTIALWRSGSLEERGRAAEYLGTYGNEQTVDALMYTLAAAARQSSASGNPGHTAFTFFGRQISLVRDFDVQVAQAAAIADPIVDVVTEGTALQVRVISNHTVRVVMEALTRLTGAAPGNQPADWVRWYEARRAVDS